MNNAWTELGAQVNTKKWSQPRWLRNLNQTGSRKQLGGTSMHLWKWTCGCLSISTYVFFACQSQHSTDPYGHNVGATTLLDLVWHTTSSQYLHNMLDCWCVSNHWGPNPLAQFACQIASLGSQPKGPAVHKEISGPCVQTEINGPCHCV